MSQALALAVPLCGSHCCLLFAAPFVPSHPYFFPILFLSSGSWVCRSFGIELNWELAPPQVRPAPSFPFECSSVFFFLVGFSFVFKVPKNQGSSLLGWLFNKTCRSSSSKPNGPLCNLGVFCTVSMCVLTKYVITENFVSSPLLWQHWGRWGNGGKPVPCNIVCIFLFLYSCMLKAIAVLNPFILLWQCFCF